MIFVLRRVMLRHECLRPDVLDTASFEKLARQTLRAALNQQAQEEIMVEAGSCRIDQRFPPQAEVDAVVSGVMARPPSEENERLALLISQLRLRRGDMEGAFDLAVQALQLPWSGAFIRNAAEFEALRDGPKGTALITASFTTQPANPDLETCNGLE